MAESFSAADLGAPSTAADLGAPAPEKPSAPPAAPVSTADLGAPSSANNLGAPAPTVPTTIATPHQYDSIIRDAAKKHGVDERLLRALGLQESGLGTGSNYDPKTGKDRDKNPGRGLFQLDPSSGASQADLNRAGTDPVFAADRAASILARNLHITHGNEREALAMYNAGIGTSPPGLTYADQVIEKSKHLDDPNYLPTQIQNLQRDHRIVQNQLRRGKSLGQALAATPTFRLLARVEGQGKVNWLWLQHHPIEGAVNVLGAPQRALGGYEYARSLGKTQREALQQVHDMVFNPTPANQARSTWGPAAVINAFANNHGHQGNVIPTHDEVDRFINAHFNRALAPYAKTIAKTGEDVALQTLSDPTFILSAVGRGVFGAAHALAKAHGIEAHLPHLGPLTQAAEHLQDVFGARRDLDRAGFTSRGKKVRLAVENAALARRTRAEQADLHAINSTNSGHNTARRFLEHVYEHGDQMHSNQAARLLGRENHAAPTGHLAAGNIYSRINDLRSGTPEEQAGILRSVRNQIAHNSVREHTLQHIQQDPSLFNGHTGVIQNLGFKDTSGLLPHIYALGKANPFATWAKKAVMVNPAPHGLRNVGTLAYLAGGIPAVFHGLVGMAKGIDKATLQRLEDMGAMPLYIQEGESKWGKVANEALERMEQGWRAGLLKTLDEKLGKSAPGSAAEMLKGQMISEKIGDYRNQSAFVHALKALGGEFVAFRLGIAPVQVAKSLASNPEHLTGLLRTKQDIQDNRSSQGKFKNTYVFGGPEEDALRLILNPQSYLSSPASVGIASSIKDENLAKSSTGVVDAIMGAAASWLPFAGPVIEEAKILGGNAMSGQKMSWADMVMASVSSMVTGGYFQKNISPKQERTEAKKVKKAQGL